MFFTLNLILGNNDDDDFDGLAITAVPYVLSHEASTYEDTENYESVLAILQGQSIPTFSHTQGSTGTFGRIGTIRRKKTDSFKLQSHISKFVGTCYFIMVALTPAEY